jgi:hypothetical protein
MKHTKEPWAINHHTIYTGEGKDRANVAVAMWPFPAHETEEESNANAQRIVTCVNACAGLSNGEVESKIPELNALYEFVRDFPLNYHKGAIDHLSWVREAQNILDRIEKGGK